MAFGRRQVAVALLLLFLVVSSTAARVPRSFKTPVKNKVLFGSFHSQDVEDIENGEKLFEIVLERRMDIEVTDYSGPGANRSHDPRTPGRT